MKLALMVAEKPSLAQSLANILSSGKCITRKGFNNSCSVHEWSGPFRGETVKFKMTSVCGHVMTMDFLGKYNDWNKVDPAELFTCGTEKKEANPKLQMPKFLQQEARGINYLILWLDCDKEGENICFEVIDAVQPVMKPPYGNEEVIYRAKFSAITDKDIWEAMNNLIFPNEKEAKSVDARMELDLRIGCAFTRFQTKFFQGKYGNLDSTLISYGPCQTPTLGFCVERHDEIKSFQPQPFWLLQAQVIHKSNKIITLEWERGRMFDKEVATFFKHTISDCKEVKVLSVVKKEKVKQRPQALNTVELMRVASSGLGMGPHHAMQIAERLYTQGYISYPRTETTHYPENFDLKSTLRQLGGGPEFGSEVKEILTDGINHPRKGSDAGDHPPITPMKLASRQELEGDAWRVYEYICSHFLATLSKDCKYLSTTISFNFHEEVFSCTGKLLLDPGYTKFMTWQAITNDETLPALEKGEVLTVKEINMLERETSPPDFLTESEVITLMEKHGIGTDASIPVHINNICQRNYVTVGSGRTLVPTTLGIVLVHGYQKIDPDLVLPTMRSALETQLNLICAGRVDFESVLRHTLQIFKLKFQYFVTNITGMDELFEVSFSPLADSGKPISRCGKCKRYMKLITAKPCRLHCSICKETYSLPHIGSIKAYQDNNCPLDDFELLTCTGGSKGKGYSFCPYCYSRPPFRDMRKATGCNSCPHPSCEWSYMNQGICSCYGCETGVLVIDPASAPKWTVACNRCDVAMSVFKEANKVSVQKNSTCEECGSQLVAVEYKAGKSKLPDEDLTATGCLFCEPTFSELVERTQVAKIQDVGHRGGGGHRGRGRGRGRGRSRGGRGRPANKKPRDKMAELAAYFV